MLVGRDRAVTPTEFWRLSPDEIWWMLEGRKAPKMYGKMTEAEALQIYEEEFGQIEE